MERCNVDSEDLATCLGKCTATALNYLAVLTQCIIVSRFGKRDHKKLYVNNN